MERRKFILNEREVNVMVSLVASLDPQRYTHDEAKAVIHKCKALVGTGESYWIVP